MPDNWVETEGAIRDFLGQNHAGSYVNFTVTLIYPDDNSGRPSEIGTRCPSIPLCVFIKFVLRTRDRQP